MSTNDGLKDIFIVEKPSDIRLIYSEKHNMILRLVMESELTISDIARKLGLNPGLVHYYLKELEKHGLVKQVREEIKGGNIKKYYRCIAKHIVLNSPDFNEMKRLEIDPGDDYIEQLIQSIEYMGYHLPHENKEDAKELLSRYDKWTKKLLKDLESPNVDSSKISMLIFNNASQMILNMRARDDPEMGRIYQAFGKLFLPYRQP